MADSAAREARIAAVRRFNRFYTRQIGVLQEGFLQTPFSLSELRVLYELAQRDKPSAKTIATVLGLDHGYLSRILRGFGERGFVAKMPAADDRRQQLLHLTTKGRVAFAAVDKRQQNAIAAMLDSLDEGEQARLVGAMEAIEAVVAPAPSPRPAFVLRPHRAGDMGFVIGHQAALYAREYGWDGSYEALVAEIAAQFLRRFDPAREHCWIAEIDGQPVGSVFVVRESDDVAKLRLLAVDPRARGQGLGRALVEEAIRFAARVGYRRMTLWTQSVLVSARAIYERTGFRLIKSEPHRSFGADLVGETWERALT